MQAIRSPTPGNPSIQTVPKPSLGPGDDDTIIVKVKYAGNNPCDWISSTIPEMWDAETIIGCDFTGIVEAVPISENRFKPGDAVFGVVAAGAATDRTRGAFAEYVPAFADFLYPLPQGHEEAPLATVGVSLLTIATSLFQDLELPFPSESGDWSCGNGRWFLVNGASTATGLMLTQWLRLAGFRVIATAGRNNWPIVKDRGVEHVFDYRNMHDCAAKIQSIVGDDLHLIYNCAMDDMGSELADKLMSSRGGKYLAIASFVLPKREDIRSVFVRGQAPSAYEYHSNLGPMKQTTKQREIGKKTFHLARKWFAEGKLKTPPIEVRQGLEGALQGMSDLKEGKVSGKKLISCIS